MFKRAFDIIISFLGIFILSPIFLAVTLAVKLEDNGPVFYRGERVGRYGRIFFIYKFRSMVINAEKIGASSTSGDDPRITRIGKIIRKYKLDELSQLLNVFLGDMSLVGPRPQVKWAVDTYNEEEKQLLQLRPGITDWASIRFHNEGEIIAESGMANPDEAYLKLIHPEKMRLQMKYLRHHSFWIDIDIIIQTLRILFVSRMAGEDKPVS